MNDTIKYLTKDKTWQGKTNVYFKDIIYNTYIMAKGKSDNIAKLLNCLNLKTPQGKPYTQTNLKYYLKTSSR